MFLRDLRTLLNPTSIRFWMPNPNIRDSSMSVKAWADERRSSEYLQNPENQCIIDAFQSLLEGKSTPETAARSINAICVPLIRRDPNDWRIGDVWVSLCEAARALGGSKEVDERLVDLLSSMKELSVTDERGNAIRHEWGGNYWTDLPAWGLTFREYGICRSGTL